MYLLYALVPYVEVMQTHTVYLVYKKVFINGLTVH